jgi:hypothetical protein
VVCLVSAFGIGECFLRTWTERDASWRWFSLTGWLSIYLAAFSIACGLLPGVSGDNAVSRVRTTAAIAAMGIAVIGCSVLLAVCRYGLKASAHLLHRDVHLAILGSQYDIWFTLNVVVLGASTYLLGLAMRPRP